MLILLRILFGGALLYALAVAIGAAESGVGGDLAPALHLAVGLFLALANAIVWAPWIGGKIADPISGMFTSDSSGGRPNLWLALAHRFEARRWRRLALLLAFAEGVRHPDQPGAFAVGLRTARPGSWLERVFAREVYRFDNIQNSVRAYQILRTHGERPLPHRNKEISATLLALDREQRPPPTVLAVPQAAAAAPRRNPRIRLFQARPAPPADPSSPEPPSA
ncbi:MAG: hypothetical protein H7A45_06190 [Verrucomicrobiales bacterium]|nr:hypothetical protein [Verrucomicrobiales bacterium]MCP5528118.1 hypothetical protein [Verrucomicrobiales bacterium]